MLYYAENSIPREDCALGGQFPCQPGGLCLLSFLVVLNPKP